MAWDEVAHVSILLAAECPRTLIDYLPNLEAVINPITGSDQIDVVALRSRGIAIEIGQVPENYEAMAEATILLMLASLYDLDAARGKQTATRRAHMLRGKTVGILGFGQVARSVVQRLQGWGTRIIVNSRHSPQGESGVTWVPLDELLMEADVLLVLCSLTAETRGILDERLLGLMRPGAVLINTARGGIVDELALANALSLGRIEAVALDVFEHEPLP